MRSVTMKLALIVGFSALVSGQAMTEAAAATAGGAIGSAAGRKVSDGVGTIFGKVDKQMSAAAGTATAAKGLSVTPSSASKAPLIQAGPGTPDDSGAPRKTSATKVAAAKTKTPGTPGEPSVVPPSAWDDVPPPPPLPNQHAVAAKPAPPRPVVVQAAPIVPQAPPPPPPQVTIEDLQKIETGMARADVLRLGQPSARITMFENGGLLEIFDYYERDPQFGQRSLGTVRLSDGSVSTVQLRN